MGSRWQMALHDSRRRGSTATWWRGPIGESEEEKKPDPAVSGGGGATGDVTTLSLPTGGCCGGGRTKTRFGTIRRAPRATRAPTTIRASDPDSPTFFLDRSDALAPGRWALRSGIVISDNRPARRCQVVGSTFGDGTWDWEAAKWRPAAEGRVGSLRARTLPCSRRRDIRRDPILFLCTTDLPSTPWGCLRLGKIVQLILKL
ncbi:hypothetical protein TIFTF001_034547 [Ficus carica]|uniref:Uncharacterized protein n=1 Tax=Ficus carica TaxID=3494 RepID=A0AA88E0P4_FICCA|nr:hypothetical protein TIFTF001_034542 [Ficus carica]GMN65483.1 hypothetical protein TIFTF001_034547 [Ficus carica]